jgi:hypothetical protein
VATGVSVVNANDKRPGEPTISFANDQRRTTNDIL